VGSGTPAVVAPPADSTGAEHDGEEPLREPLHFHVHSPDPSTAEAMPDAHKSVLGAALTATPFAAPHSPLMT
jgi:hypothetical protein